MATGYCDPNADSTPIQWHPNVGGTHYQVIDGGIRTPTAPTTDNIYAGDGDENAQGTVQMGTLTVATVTRVRVWTYGTNTAGEIPFVRIQIGGWAANQSLDMGAGYGWYYRDFNGSWSQADLNGLLVRYTADSLIGKLDGIWIRACYAEVTYTAPVVGYGHDFNGVPAANISNVSGVPTANIANIKGVV